MVSVILCEWSLCASAPITEVLIALDREPLPQQLGAVAICPPKNPGQCRRQEHIWCLPNKGMVGIYTGHTTEMLATLIFKAESQSRTILNGGLAGLRLEQMIIPNTKTAQRRTELWCWVSTCYQSMPLLPNETVHLQRGVHSPL